MLKDVGWMVLVSILTGAVRIAASLAFVASSKVLVDIATGISDEPLGKWMAILIGILVLQVLSGIFFNWWESYITTITQNKLREKTFAHVMRSRWEGRERFLSGDTVNRLEEDIRVVADILCYRAPGIVITLLQLVAASIYLTSLASNLIWILLGLMVAMIISARLFYPQLRRLTASIRSSESNLQQVMQESLQNRVLVLTMTGAERALGKFTGIQQKIVDNTVKRLNYNAVARGLMNFGFQAGYAAAFIWGILGIQAGTITYGMMTAFLQLVIQVQRPVAEISRQIPAFIHAMTSVERLLELEDLPEEASGEKIALSGAPEIRIESVTYGYPGQKRPVLRDFSHIFPSGSLTVIAGPTGIGKSTLIRLVLGLLKPSEGTVSIDGHPAGLNLIDNFQYIPQGNSLVSGTIRENLLMADPGASEQKMEEALETAAAGFVMDLPEGLDTVCGEVGSGLSEGQAQRIAIARGVLRDGGILVLDEATSALDIETERLLLENLSRKFQGRRTILFISHREAVARYADDTVTLGTD